MNISIACTNYVGPSSAVLLAQHNRGIALDIDQGKEELINACMPPIQDIEIELLQAEHPCTPEPSSTRRRPTADADFVRSIW